MISVLICNPIDILENTPAKILIVLNFKGYHFNKEFCIEPKAGEKKNIFFKDQSMQICLVKKRFPKSFGESEFEFL